MKTVFRRTAIIRVQILTLIIMLWASSLNVGDAWGNGLPGNVQGKIIDKKFFGLHIHRATSTTPWPTAAFGTWRLWDTYTAWPWLEGRKGVWNFSNLDKIMDLAKKHQVEVILPLGLSPSWASARPTESSAYAPGSAAEPANIEDWKNYVRTVVSRYGDQVNFYEIWNEPNLVEHYSGTIDNLILLEKEAANIIRDLDPTARIVAPSPVGAHGVQWFDKFLAKGGGDYIDIIGFHFYTGNRPPEYMVSLISSVKQLMTKYNVADKPLWNTEAGWFIKNSNSTVPGNPIAETDASAYLVRAFVLNWLSGVERYCYYAWDNGLLGLTESDGKTLKEPAHTYGRLIELLEGAKLMSYSVDESGTYICGYERPLVSRFWIIWNPNGKTNFVLPSTWNSEEQLDFAGNRMPLKVPYRVEIIKSRAQAGISLLNTVYTKITQVNVGPAPIVIKARWTSPTDASNAPSSFSRTDTSRLIQTPKPEPTKIPRVLYRRVTSQVRATPSPRPSSPVILELYNVRTLKR